MKVKQLSIFLENKVGRLLETTEVLSQHEINIRAMSLAETSHFGIVRLIVENTEKACNLLKMHDFTVEMTDVIAIEVNDKPGQLCNFLRIMDQNKINIEYCYAYVERKQDKAVVIAKIEEIDKALDVLAKNNVKILSQDDLYQ